MFELGLGSNWDLSDPSDKLVLFVLNQNHSASSCMGWMAEQRFVPGHQIIT